MRLKADSVRLTIQPAALAGDRAVEIIAGIDLQARLIGQELHYAPVQGRLQTRGEPQLAVTREAECVIVALAVSELLIVLPDAGADGRCAPEIEGRAGNAARRPGQRNGGGVDHQEL